ncbi:hypothetical protein APY03_2896 [Variovorax sp. WDL1]|nr:hypothetical protein APY03_2896 [Variovorax sp. WDL1]
MRQQRGHEAGAAADLEHRLVLLDVQVLQHAGLDLRREHALAGLLVGGAFEREFHVEECEAAMGLGHIVLAADLREQFEDLVVQYIPGADLLLDHVEAQALQVVGGIHGRVHGGVPRAYRGVGGRFRSNFRF